MKSIDELIQQTKEISHEALRRYFVRLTQYGYYNYDAVYRLMALMMINNFREEFRKFITTKDESIIERVLNCLYCSICAIPMPDNIENVQLTVKGNTRNE